MLTLLLGALPDSLELLLVDVLKAVAWAGMALCAAYAAWRNQSVLLPTDIDDPDHLTTQPGGNQ